MAYHAQDGRIGYQPIANTETVKQHPLGTRLRATDPTYGAGEFIYLEGVANTAVGSWVLINPDDWTTTLASANAIGSFAVAMSANVASQFGWYQIYGKGVGKCLTLFADNGNVFLTSTAGSVDDASVAGDYITGAKGASLTAVSSGVADFELHYPWSDDKTANT